MNVGKIVVRGVLVAVAFIATLYLSSVGFELTNAADDLSVAAGAAIIVSLWAAWSFVSLRVLQYVIGKKGESDEELE